MAVNFHYAAPGLRISQTLTPAPEALPYRLHSHDQLELYCFLRGKGIFHIEGTDYALQPGDVLIMQPSESHYIELQPGVPYERIVVNVTRDFLLGLDPEGWLLAPFLDRTPGTNNLYRSGEFPGGSGRFFEKIRLPGGSRRVNVLVGLMELLDALHRLWHGRAQDSTAQSLEWRIISHINQSLHTPLTLDELCQRFYISKSQLCRLFKRSTGTTVWNYITLKRLSKARQLLESGQSPTQICARCGFSDYSTFYRAYTRTYGHAPTKLPPLTEP